MDALLSGALGGSDVSTDAATRLNLGKAELFDGASAALRLSGAYCEYLLGGLSTAIEAAADPLRDQPHLNVRTVFCDDWHSGTLSRFSDADIANAWRLADYLMLPALAVRCLEDVSVQRTVRSSPGGGRSKPKYSPLPPAPLIPERLSLLNEQQLRGVSTRVADIRDVVYKSSNILSLVSGVAIPVDGAQFYTSATWGHLSVLQAAHAAGCKGAAIRSAQNAPAFNGHKKVWEWLLTHASLHGPAIRHACMRGHQQMAIWAVARAPKHLLGTLQTATEFNSLHVLEWARDNGHLTQAMIRHLISLVDRFPWIRNNKSHTWLQSLLH